jgi:hypothetical protein
MYELEYWCPCQGVGRWLRVEGPDYDDLPTAIAMANWHAGVTGRVMRVVDGWQGQVYYQT